MMDDKFLNQYINKGKAMPQRLLILITYAKALLAPTMGIGFIWTFIELVDIPSKSIIGIVGTAIIAFFTYLATRANARTRVEVKSIESKESADIDRASFGVKIFELATADIEKARLHYSEELKAQRLDFFQKEQENTDRFLAKQEEIRRHYESREDEIRQSYHKKNNENNDKMSKYITRCTKIEIQLKSLGITVTDDYELVLPSTFERRKSK
jgi:hypothetical protein